MSITFRTVLAPIGLMAAASCSAPQFAVEPSYGQFKPDGDVGYSDQGAGVSGTSSVDALDLDESEGTLGLRADFKWGAPHLTVSTQSSSWDGDGTLEADFGGISAGLGVATELDLALHRGVLTFDVLPTSNFELGLGFGVTVADLEASVTQSGTNNRESADEVAPIPLLAVRGGVRIWKLDFEALVSGMSIGLDGDDATYIEADINAKLSIFGSPGGVNGTVVLGYRQIDLDVEYDDGGESADVNLSFSGPYFGLQLGI